jgi:hypothetical protein
MALTASTNGGAMPAPAAGGDGKIVYETFRRYAG